jgi:hypothetical protein
MKLGPTFGAEVIAAGLDGLGLYWSADTGNITGRESLTRAQNRALDVVVATHDPNKRPPQQFSPNDTAMQQFLNRAAGATWPQTLAFVQANVSNLADARVMLARLLYIIGRRTI